MLQPSIAATARTTASAYVAFAILGAAVLAGGALPRWLGWLAVD